MERLHLVLWWCGMHGCILRLLHVVLHMTMILLLLLMMIVGMTHVGAGSFRWLLLLLLLEMLLVDM